MNMHIDILKKDMYNIYMLEYNKVYHCGKKTFTFFLVRHGWPFFTLALLLIYTAYEMYFGRLEAKTTAFLGSFPDLYISTGMLSEWILLTGLSLILIGYIRSKVLHRKIRFKIDQHAFHLREGLFMIKESVIPYRQISNVHLVRPYIYRMLGLSRLDIMTVSDKDVLRRATGKKSGDFLIPLIDTSIARELAEHLMHHASDKQKPVFEDEGGDDVFNIEEDTPEVTT